MKRFSRKGRRGAILIAVLVCLGVVTSILLGTLQLSLRQRRQLQRELQMEQTDWLLDAGIRRAVFNLKANPNYQGETIRISPTLDDAMLAQIEISVPNDDKAAEKRPATATARLNHRDETGAVTQRSKSIVLLNRNEN